MSELLIDTTFKDMAKSFTEEMLNYIQLEMPKQHQTVCPHCGDQIYHIIVAREQDINDFQLILTSAHRVMQKYGITLNLLAEIRAECFYQIAKKKALGDNNGKSTISKK